MNWRHQDMLVSVAVWPGVDCYSGTSGGVNKHAVGK